MKNEMNATVMELETGELEMVVGGDVLDDVFMQYVDYVNSLYDKYNCWGKGIRYLKTVCTLEELSDMGELWDIFVTQLDR